MRDSLVDRASVERLLLLVGALRSGLIDALASEGPASADQVAAAAGADARASRIVLEALAEEGIAERTQAANNGALYRLTPAARAHLVDAGPLLERSGLIHQANKMGGWLELPEVIRTGRPAPRNPDRTSLTALVSAMGERDPQILDEIVDRCHDYAGKIETMVDIGGAVGHLARQFARRGVKATLFDREEVLPVARQFLGEDASSIAILGGDYTVSLPAGPFDLVYFGNVYHIYGRQTNARVTRDAFLTTAKGGAIAIQDYVWGLSDRSAMFAVNMLRSTDGGKVWTEADFRGWLSEAGFIAIQVVDIETAGTQLISGGVRRNEQRDESLLRSKRDLGAVMERFLVRDEIWWVGVIDWNLRDFHGYETPRGTTYNSYLILDEKVALVDGCRDGFGPEMLARIRGCCGLRPIDYMVINHVEPDHSGAIPWLVEQLKPGRMFCTKRAKDALALLYGSDTVDRWDLQVVATGDELPLGRNTLQFIEAPMIHWPDSMFTYVRGSKTLLPNDGFGQHLATSKRFSDEVDWCVALEEASTYYANILMPFGVQIRRMLDKIGEMGLEIEAIGPSHGVIWRGPGDVERIVAAYMNWTSFKAPERVTLVYDSMWHSTEKMTMAVADGVAQEGVECRVIRLSVSPRSEAAHQILESRAFLVGTPTINNGVLPTIGAFLTYIKGLRPKNRVAGAYGSCGWAGGGVKQADEELRTLGLDVVEPLEVKYAPSDTELDACVELGRNVARRVKAME